MDIFPNQTVVFQWFLFMTALVALHYGVFRPVLHLLRERRERTAGERQKAEELAQRAALLLAECEKRMMEARGIGSDAREERLREAEQVTRELIQGARQELDKQVEKLKRQIEQEGREASLRLRQYGQEIGKEMAEQILERNLR